MANPADNLNNIADSSSRISDYTHNTWMTSDSIDSLMFQMNEFASKISDYTYNAQVSLDFIDRAVTETFDILETGIDGILVGLEHIMENTERSAGDLADINVNTKDGGAKSTVVSQPPPGDKLSKIIDDALDKLNKNESDPMEGAQTVQEKNQKDEEKNKKKRQASTSNLINFINATVASFKFAYSAISGVATAVMYLQSTFMGMAKKIGMFVGAYNPALVARFGLVLADLMATIGYSLQPMFIAFIAIIKKFAGMLLPIVQQSLGAVGKLTEAWLSIVMPVIVVLANAFKQLVPIINTSSTLGKELGGAMSFMVPVVMAVVAIFAILFQIFAITIHLVIGVIKMFVLGIVNAIESLGRFAIWLLGLEAKEDNVAENIAEGVVGNVEGIGAGIDGIVKAVENFGKMPEEKDPSGMAARGASYAGIGDLGKNLMQAAFGSSTEKIQQQQLDQQKQMAQALNNIQGILGGNNANKNMAGVRN